jgi:uncharacterized protein involved in exopolysaccharide biosynthesis
MSPVRAFATVAFGVFLVIFGCAALATSMLPKTYRATARVIALGPASSDAFLSSGVLQKVSEKLQLRETLAARFGEKEPLDEDQVHELLRRWVQVRSVRGTEIIEIHAHSVFPKEASELANAVAAAGVTAQPQSSRGPARMLEQAVPPVKPVRPNKPLNLALGAVVGIFLGVLAGGVGAKLAVGFDGRD